MYNNIKLTNIFALEWFGIFSELPANNICIFKMPTAKDIGFFWFPVIAPINNFYPMGLSFD